MIGLIKGLMSPKVGARLILRASFTTPATMRLQALVRGSGLLGVVRVTPSYAQLELEGSKAKVTIGDSPIAALMVLGKKLDVFNVMESK